MSTSRFSLFLLSLTLLAFPLQAQKTRVHTVGLDGAREVVAELNGGYGTISLKRGDNENLLTITEIGKEEEYASNVHIEYSVENNTGFLTVDLGTEGNDDLNALACLMKGSRSRTWEVTVSDRVPIRFDITLGAGEATIDLTDVHVRGFHLDAGAGSVRLRIDRPNRERTGEVSVSAGVGSFRGEGLGNLRFSVLDFEGGLGEYYLDCSGDLSDRSRIVTDVGVGSLTIVLPKSVAAKAVMDDSWLNSRRLSGFVRHGDETYFSRNYKAAERRVLLQMQSGLGSVAVRWNR